MALEGSMRWTGPPPDVIELTDNGTRKVMLRLAQGRFEVEVVLNDPAAFIRELETAMVWVREG